MISYRQDAVPRPAPAAPAPVAPRRLTAAEMREIVAQVTAAVMAEMKPLLARATVPIPNLPKPPSIADVASAAAAVSGIGLTDLLGVRRDKQMTQIRQVAMLVCCDCVYNASLTMIGRAFSRDHTTVLHARKVTRKRLAAGDPVLVALHGSIMARLGAAA